MQCFVHLNLLQNDTARVNVSIEDINEWEPRFRHPRYEFHARTMREGSIVGRLEAADGDRGDRVALSLRGPDARLHFILTYHNKTLEDALRYIPSQKFNTIRISVLRDITKI